MLNTFIFIHALSQLISDRVVVKNSVLTFAALLQQKLLNITYSWIYANRYIYNYYGVSVNVMRKK